MTPTRDSRRWWRYLGGLTAPALLWALLIYLLADTFRNRLQGDEKFDEAALREWIEESRPFRETLPELIRTYLKSADPDNPEPAPLEQQTEAIQAQLQSLCDPLKEYQQQLPLFPAVYRLELNFSGPGPKLKPIVWESNIPRPQNTRQVQRLDYVILGPNDARAQLGIEYQLHAYNKKQRDEQAAAMRSRA